MIPLAICPNKDCKNKKTCIHKQVHEQDQLCDQYCASPFREDIFASACVPYDGVQLAEHSPDNTKVPLSAKNLYELLIQS